MFAIQLAKIHISFDMTCIFSNIFIIALCLIEKNDYFCTRNLILHHH